MCICALLPYGCQKSNAWEAEGQALLAENQRLKQKHEDVDARIDSLWDATTEALRSAIPADFPPTDREIFLNARNAAHIKMFMSYKSLPAETQLLVNVADSLDQLLAKDIEELQSAQIEFEQKKLDFLIKVNRDNPSASLHYTQMLRDPIAHLSE
jgi:hypothetical protein